VACTGRVGDAPALRVVEEVIEHLDDVIQRIDGWEFAADDGDTSERHVDPPRSEVLVEGLWKSVSD
jgi:hypothetical protein